MATSPVYGEFLNLEEKLSPEEILDLHPTEAAQRRMDDLISREKIQGLSPEETRELDDYLRFEHFVRMMKANAMKAIKSKSHGE